MNNEQRLEAFVQLGKILTLFRKSGEWPGYSSGISEEEFKSFNEAIYRAASFNGWFTENNVRFALDSLSGMLKKEKLVEWNNQYDEIPESKNVAIIMAGNIPMVGFHDLLCVLISGHRATIKLSSNDKILLPEVMKLLTTINPDFESAFEIVDSKLTRYDAVIATGSDNSSRYFESYFGHVPNIIRKNRTSIAILDGSESENEMLALGDDVFRYFGLGCRNVSKVLIPEGYDIDKLFKGLYPYSEVINHHKYANNYDYNRTIYLMNQDKLLENGFLLLKEDERLFSPLAVLFYQKYQDKKEVATYLENNADKLQCLVSKDHIPFGMTQQPGLSDYADGVDTMFFLRNLN